MRWRREVDVLPCHSRPVEASLPSSSPLRLHHLLRQLFQVLQPRHQLRVTRQLVVDADTAVQLEVVRTLTSVMNTNPDMLEAQGIDAINKILRLGVSLI